MDNLLQLKTDWVKHNGDLISRVTYGFDTEFANKNNQSPHFALTVETYRKPDYNEQCFPGSCITVNNGRYTEFAFGQCADTVRAVFPELVALLPFHLVSIGQGPMHYKANGLYHLGLAGYPDAFNLDHFRSTVLYGQVPSDANWVLPDTPNAEGMTKEYFDTLRAKSIGERLDARLPWLVARFREVMKQHGLLTETQTKRK